MNALVYRWKDGANVWASSENGSDSVRLVVRPSGSSPDGVELFVHSNGTISSFSHQLGPCCSDLERRRKFAGLVLELGAVTRPVRSKPGMIQVGLNESLVDYPSWVPDDEWVRRYEIGRDRVSSSGRSPSKTGSFIGSVDELSIQSEPSPIRKGVAYVGWWGSPGDKRRTSVCGSVEEVVDEICRLAVMLPASYRSLWEPSNVERGIWVHPSSEEVEIYRYLGDSLPFFWPGQRFSEWLIDQVKVDE